MDVDFRDQTSGPALPGGTAPPAHDAPTAARRYGMAALASAAAVVWTVALRPFLGQTLFLLFYPAVVLSAWYGGIGPGMLAVLLGLIAVDYFFLQPTGSLALAEPAEAATFAVLMTAAGFVGALLNSLQSARRQAEHRERQAQLLARRLEAQTAELESANERLLASTRAAEAANHAKSNFLAMMSHEIRTPINAMLGYTDLLDLGLSGPVTEKQRAQFARMRESGRHLIGLVNEVLDLAKIEAGETTIEREPGRASVAVDSALDLVQPQALERGLIISDECPPGAGTTYLGDATRVRQIVLNLLANAVKFTESGGRIHVACGAVEQPDDPVVANHPGPWIFIRVTDTGIGVPPEKVSSIFEPFVQADLSLTRARGGTGLGLAISRKLARLMDGDLTLRSQQGEGSTFTLWLPAAHAAEAYVDASREPVSTVVADPPVAGVAEIARDLLDEVDAVATAFVRALRHARLVDHVEEISDAALRDHVPTLLTDIAESLMALQEGDHEATDLLRDGSTIQRAIADRHGLQRYRIGWTDSALVEEFALLRSELESAVRAAAARRPGADVDEILSRLDRFLEQAQHVSLRSFRVARRASGVGRGART